MHLDAVDRRVVVLLAVVHVDVVRRVDERRRAVRPVLLRDEAKAPGAADVLERQPHLDVVADQDVPDVDRGVERQARRVPSRGELDGKLERLREHGERVFVIRERIRGEPHREVTLQPRREHPVLMREHELGDAEVRRRRREQPQPTRDVRLVSDRDLDFVHGADVKVVELHDRGLDDEDVRRVCGLRSDRRERGVALLRSELVPQVIKFRLRMPRVPEIIHPPPHRV
eukprot:31431-Pelagococcus_subviridis.AAC.5